MKIIYLVIHRTIEDTHVDYDYCAYVFPTDAKIKAEEIRICARPGKGVRVMRTSEQSKLVTLARVPNVDGEESDDIEVSKLPEDDVADDIADETENEIDTIENENSDEE